MATYLILNTIVLAIIVAITLLWRQLTWHKAIAVTLAVLLVTTAVFDSLIISAGIVAYDANRLLGVTIGAAPIEDFFYAVAAAVLIPALWNVASKGNQHG